MAYSRSSFRILKQMMQVVDSMVVERARGESQSTSGSLQSLCWGSSAFGGIVSAYFSGSLVDTYGVRHVSCFLFLGKKGMLVELSVSNVSYNAKCSS